ncbi:MAG: hypothetical protein IT442_04625 [Phycisphaeraceae bacterium]|nr:hypothetical protein [Phycisphaeraceae bacterium]
MARPSSAVEGRWSASLRAVVMLTLLVVSLAMAVWISELRRPGPPLTLTPQMHGPLTLSTPDGWTTAPSDVPPALLRDATVLRRPDSDQELLIARLPDAPPRSPLRALDEAYLLLVHSPDPHDESPAPVARFRIGPILGAQRLSLDADDRGNPRKQLLAVLTLAGRQYWVLRLSGSLLADPNDPQAVNRELVFDRRLFESILESVSLANLRPAGQADFHALGLDPASIEGYDFWIDPAQLPDAPLIVLPTQGHAYLQTLRLRAEVGCLPDDPRDPLSPPQLMARRFEAMFGRLPDRSQLAVDSLQDMPVLRMHLGVDPATGFFRELWCLRPTATTALLAEIAAEGPPQVGQELVALLLEFRRMQYPQASPGHDANPDQQLSDMLDRGRRIVAGQIRLAPSLADPQPQAHLLVHDHWPVAWELSRHRLAADPDDKTLHWDAAGMFGTILRYRITADMAPDGSSFTQQSLLSSQSPDDQPPRLSQTFMALRDGVLTYASGQPGQEQPDAASWRIPAPDPLVIPLIDTAWPLEELSKQNAPALAWMSLGFLRPAPCRVHLVPADTSSHGQPVLVARPLMAMDPALMLLDSQGRAVRYQWLWDSADPGMTNRRYTTSRVTLQALLDAFPQAGPAIEQTQEEITHEP